MILDHPLQPELTRRYRLARAEWSRLVAMGDRGRCGGMSERTFCDAYVSTMADYIRTFGRYAGRDRPLRHDRAFVDADRLT